MPTAITTRQRPGPKPKGRVDLSTTVTKDSSAFIEAAKTPTFAGHRGLVVDALVTHAKRTKFNP